MNISGIIVMIAAMLVSFIFGGMYGVYCTIRKINRVFGEQICEKILEGLHYVHYDNKSDISEEDKEQ